MTEDTTQKDIQPIDVLDKMKEKEFISYSKIGYNYIMFDAPKINGIENGEVVNIGGEFYKVNGNLDEFVQQIYELSDDDIKSFLLNEFAKTGVTLAFIQLSREGVISKTDVLDGRKISNQKFDEEMRKEMKVLDNTAFILRKIVMDKKDLLGINPDIKEKV